MKKRRLGRGEGEGVKIGKERRGAKKRLAGS